MSGRNLVCNLRKKGGPAIYWMNPWIETLILGSVGIPKGKNILTMDIKKKTNYKKVK